MDYNYGVPMTYGYEYSTYSYFLQSQLNYDYMTYNRYDTYIPRTDTYKDTYNAAAKNPPFVSTMECGDCLRGNFVYCT